MELDKTIIESIDIDIISYEDYLKEVAEMAIANEVTKYPIFVLHQKESIDVGRPIIDLTKSKTKWSVNISHLEDFVLKGIVKENNVDRFRAVYKNPSKYLCIFVLDDGVANFIFRPFTSTI